MDPSNKETKSKQIRFSIGSYSEKDKRVINKIARNGLCSSSNCESFHQTITSPESRQIILRTKFAILDKTESPKYNRLSNLSRVLNSSIETPTRPNSGYTSSINTGSFQKSKNSPSSTDNNCLLIKTNGSVKNKPTHPPKLYNRSISLEPNHLTKSKKVALIITAYEGEPKTPTRLEFLPQMRLLRSNSKTSNDASSSIDNTESISSRLQNELITTLKKSNLKNKNDKAANGLLYTSENNTQISNQNNMETTFINENVKKLTAILDKKITFRINSERNEQIADNKIDM